MSDPLTTATQDMAIRRVQLSIAHIEERISSLREDIVKHQRTSVDLSDLHVVESKLMEAMDKRVDKLTAHLEDLINKEIDRMANELRERLAQELCEVIDEMMSDE